MKDIRIALLDMNNNHVNQGRIQDFFLGGRVCKRTFQGV